MVKVFIALNFVIKNIVCLNKENGLGVCHYFNLILAYRSKELISPPAIVPLH